MSVLTVDPKTGQKICINPFSESLGIANTWIQELLFDGSLFAILAGPIALAWYLFQAWRVARNKP